MEKIVKKIFLVYYSFYISTFFLALYVYVNSGSSGIVDSKSNLGIYLTQFAIAYLIISIPLSLGLFFKMTKKWRSIEDDALKFKMYQKGSMLRLVVIGSGLLVSIILFYLLKDVSLIFCAGISAIALIFCKPSVAKMNSELKLDEQED